jgi:membrane protein YqaA with SNARE-associated domain
MLRRLYEWTMAKAADKRAEWWLALFAFVEASFFPIPHPVLGLMCLSQPKKAVRFAIITTLASVAGAAGLHHRPFPLRQRG